MNYQLPFINLPKVIARAAGLLCAAALLQGQAPPRAPRGVYVTLELNGAINQAQQAAYSPNPPSTLPPYPNPNITPDPTDAVLVAYFTTLLDNPAISGLAPQIGWVLINPTGPGSNAASPAPGAYLWNPIDDMFTAVNNWNNAHPGSTPKTIEILDGAGFNSPGFVFDDIDASVCGTRGSGCGSCDALFQSPAPTPPPSTNCGYTTIFYKTEGGPVEQLPLPMPWNSVYKADHQAYLTALYQHILGEPSSSAFVGIDISGPTASSSEMILPNSANQSVVINGVSNNGILTLENNVPTVSGLTAPMAWNLLVGNHFGKGSSLVNTDQAFVDEWDNAIDLYAKIFSGITLELVTTTDALPDFSNTSDAQPAAGFTSDCGIAAEPRAEQCAAVTKVLAHFTNPSVGGNNAKLVYEAGMTAARDGLDLGTNGVKWLAAVTAAGNNPLPGTTSNMSRILGGTQFAHSFSNASDLQSEGCPQSPTNCSGLTPGQGFENVLQLSYFPGTAAAAAFGAATAVSYGNFNYSNAPMNFLEIYDGDVLYAAGLSGCTVLQITGNPSKNVAPDMSKCLATTLDVTYTQNQLNLTSQSLLGIAEVPVVEPTPLISLVANAEGENPVIAPNTWVEVKGANLAPAGDTRTWQGSDFLGGQMPTNLDGVSVTVNGKAAYVYYISPTQVNILAPPDAMSGTVQVVVTDNGSTGAAYPAQAESISPSFFVFGDGKHVAAVYANGALLGPASLSAPGYTFAPAQPGETVQIYANGFGATSAAVASGSISQSGTLAVNPVVTIGGVNATVNFAGLISPGLFQFNVVVPLNAPGGDEAIVATYNGQSTQSGTLLTLTGSAPSTAVTYYVAPNGKDSWSGTLAAPNPGGTDGPFATIDHARAAVQALKKTGLTQIAVQIRAGTYYQASTLQFTAPDSGSPALSIVYQNYPGEAPVISGGLRVAGWTNVSGNMWKAALPGSTAYFENLFYNGARRLRPRLGSGSLGTYFRVVATVYLNAPAPPAAAPDPNCPAYIAGSGWECFDRFQYASTDPISATWKNLAPPAGNPCGEPAGNAALAGDIEVVDFEMYTASKLRINCVDAKNHIVYMTGPTGTETGAHVTAHGFIANHRYLVENVEDQLAQAGQWFLDRSTSPWTLTYVANPGENPNNDTVIVPQLTPVMATSNLQYVAFQGLTFEHDNYTIPAAGHPDYELPYDISAAVSIQASQHVVFDSGIVTQTSGAGLEIAPCTNNLNRSRCVAVNANGVSANNTVSNSAFYDTGENGIRIGMQGLVTDTDANVPQFNTIRNNVVDGFGRTSPNAWGISQGEGHNNVYTHNDVYDGYHTAIGVCECSSDIPGFEGTANNTISFNHVYNLFQGIMNDAGSLYFGVGDAAITPPGNQVLNNKVHDVSDASALDADGYGGHGIYIDDITGLVDVENNLVYRVSGDAVNLPKAPPAAGLGNTIRNNILAFGRLGMINDTNPYPADTQPASQIQAFAASNNLFYFDRSDASTPAFYVQNGCTYAAGFPYVQYQDWSSNLYWRTDGAFTTYGDAFHVQPNQGPESLCVNNATKWTFLSFAQWQTQAGEDVHSVVQNPGFNNPAYPADDYSLPKGSPGAGFVVFDLTQPGRENPVIMPPAIAATFPTKTFNPATDF